MKLAFCPPGVVEANPCLDYTKHIIFPRLEVMEIQRKESNGGNMCVLNSIAYLSILPSSTYNTYEALEADYIAGILHPGDLKSGLTAAINEYINVFFPLSLTFLGFWSLFVSILAVVPRSSC